MENRINGFSVTTQLPLDDKVEVKNIAQISTLGLNNNKAFTYYRNMVIRCLEEGVSYRWQEILNSEQGLLASDYTYPVGSICMGIDYSNKVYNFVLVPPILNIVSNSLISTIVGDTQTLELPQTSSVPSIYINNSYFPTYDDWLKANKLANNNIPIIAFDYVGEGTLAKPFTNTIRFVLNSPLTLPTITSDSAMQNGIAYFIGSGTRLLPQRSGQKIQILSSIFGYTYAGDFSVSDLDLEIGGYIISTTIGKLIDMDNPAHFSNSNVGYIAAKLTMLKDSLLEIQGSGFWNSGNSVNSSTYISGKTLYLFGEGEITSLQTDINKYLINSGTTFLNNQNAGFLTFEITCRLTAPQQGIVKNEGKSKIEFRENASIGSGTLTSPINPLLEAIKITGGWVRVFNCLISVQSFVDVLNPDRERAITLDAATIDLIDGPLFIARNCEFRGHAKRFFDRKGIAGRLDISNCNTVYFSTDLLINGGGLITSTGNSNIWGINSNTEGSVVFNSNVFEGSEIDTVKIDLTLGGYRSAYNIIGRDIIESLRIFPDKQAAIIAGLPIGAAFIVRRDITSNITFASYPIGTAFRIATQSSPIRDFSSVGAPDNNVNTLFIKSAVNLAAWNPADGAVLHYEYRDTI